MKQKTPDRTIRGFQTGFWKALEAVGEAQRTDDFDVVGFIGQHVVVNLAVIGHAEGDKFVGQ